MTSKTKKEILKARPNLSDVSPVSFWFIMLMGVFNLVLGVALFTTFDSDKFTASLIIVNSIFTFQFWGTAFFILGLYKLYSLYINDWWLARRSLLIGVGLKSGWMVALLIRIIEGGTVFLALCWVAIALTQIICYIFFLPPQEMRHFSGKIIKED